MSEYIVDIPSGWYLARHMYDSPAYYEMIVPSESIVRCRDCRFCSFVEYEEHTDRKLEEPFCNCTGKLTTSWDYFNDCVQYNPVEPDGFCAWGESKDGD